MAGSLGVVGSGGDAVGGDGHAAGIGGTVGVGRSPVEGPVTGACQSLGDLG